jgi:hypothetical protein
MIPIEDPHSRTRRRRIAAGATGLALLSGALSAAPAQAAPSQTIDPLHPNFGPNVQIFSPATPLAEIQSTMDTLADQQRDAEMSSARKAVYFLPGDYGTAGAPLQFEVGYYTEVAGLGASPNDVSVNGSIEVYNRCLENGGTSNCIALNNFWRTLSNLSIQVNKAGQDGCRQSANFWAVSQAIAGVTIDAGPALSPVLLTVGKEKSGKKLDPRNPITLSDVYFRVGGPHTGKTTTALEVNANNVLIDHIWVWRADHGIEGFTNGVNGDTDRWQTNIGTNGVIVNGDSVTATGMFVEHFQKFNTVWNGENGRVILYQNELPYDPPTQADWTQPDGTLGYPGYKVGPKVKKHFLEGAGVYVFNQNNPSIVTANGFTAPNTPGVTLRHIMTVNLAAGTIQHVVNGVGAQVDSSAPGVPSYVVQYPAP